MDGTLAAIFLLASLGDMGLTHCPTGCLARGTPEARIGLQAAATEFDRTIIGEEIGLVYDAPLSYGPVRITAAATLTDRGRLWIGAGGRWQERIGRGPLFVEASLMPGIDMMHNDPALGGNLQFRSSLGLGWEFGTGAQIVAAYDHRSNADTRGINPGLETISIRYSLTFD